MWVREDGSDFITHYFFAFCSKCRCVPWFGAMWSCHWLLQFAALDPNNASELPTDLWILSTSTNSTASTSHSTPTNHPTSIRQSNWRWCEWSSWNGKQRTVEHPAKSSVRSNNFQSSKSSGRSANFSVPKIQTLLLQHSLSSWTHSFDASFQGMWWKYPNHDRSGHGLTIRVWWAILEHCQNFGVSYFARESWKSSTTSQHMTGPIHISRAFHLMIFGLKTPCGREQKNSESLHSRCLSNIRRLHWCPVADVWDGRAEVVTSVRYLSLPRTQAGNVWGQRDGECLPGLRYVRLFVTFH